MVFPDSAAGIWHGSLLGVVRDWIVRNSACNRGD